MPRFVVLHHLAPPAGPRETHWDLMLEQDGKLETWALPAPLTPNSTQPGQRLANHRIRYLDYEGPISDNRGSVKRWDWGTYVLLNSSPNLRDVQLSGQQQTVHLVLRRDEADSEIWSIRCGTAAEPTQPDCS
ncbi:MAG: DNA polymerase ligase N-terminal domain-containing protein [Planctomycetota bacterium]|nr:DNA polymerase ligase N-terminal domain-containing protein [Planctomycetota bacterium]